MPNVIPASNVQAAAVSAFLSPVIEHICAANGFVLPPDANAALPGLIAVVVAYLWDCHNGGNKPNKAPDDAIALSQK